MKAPSSHRTNALVIAALVILAIVTHRPWFRPSTILTHGDWSYWPPHAVRELWSSWGSWSGFGNLGEPNVQMQFLPFVGVWSGLAHLGVSFDTAAKATFFIPIAILGFVGPYLLIKAITKSTGISFFVALFYASTPYFLVRQGTQPTVAFVYALAPVVILCFMRAMKGRRIGNWILFSVVFTVGVVYEVRMMLIVTGMLFLLALAMIHKASRQTAVHLVIAGAVLAGLNAFWTLPTLVGSRHTIGQVAGRGLFGNNLFDLPHALVGVDSSWTGRAPNEQFVTQPLRWYFWFVPALSVTAIFVLRRLSKMERRLFIAFAFITLTGIFLTKQSAAPFPGAYGWLYGHVPGFSLFREASQFYLLTCLGYAGMLSISLLGLKRRMLAGTLAWAAYVIPLAIAAIAFINFKPLVFGEFGTLFTSRMKPHSYQVLQSFIERQPEFFRTLWVPRSSRWSPFSVEHPEMNIVNLTANGWDTLLTPAEQQQLSPAEKMLALLSKPNIEQVLNAAAVKYVVVPMQDLANQDDFSADYGKDIDAYVAALNASPFLKHVDINTGQIEVYENMSPGSYIAAFANGNSTAPRIDSPANAVPTRMTERLEFRLPNPTRRAVGITGLSAPLTLTSADLFDPGWKLYLRPLSKETVCNPISQTNPETGSAEVAQCSATADQMSLSDIAYLWRHSDFNDTHLKTIGSTNGWVLDPSFITAHYSHSYWRADADGGIDLNLVVYYKPQSYFYVGLMLSLATAALSILLLILSWRRRRAMIGDLHDAPVVESS